MHEKVVTRREDAVPAASKNFLFVIPVVLLWLAPIVALATFVPIAQSQDQLAYSVSPPATVQIGSRSQDYRQSVDIEIRYTREVSVLSPSAGVITSVDMAKGSVIGQGQQLVSVDGVPVLAYEGLPPLYRDLSRGMSGNDVLSLNEYFSRLGYGPAATGSTIGNATVTRIHAFQRSIGVQPDGTFRLSYIAFISNADQKVAEVTAQVGTLIAAGGTLVTTTPAAESLRFLPSSENASLTSLRGSALKLKVGDEDLPLTSITPSSTELVSIDNLLKTAALSGTVTATARESKVRYASGLLELAKPMLYAAAPGTAIYVSPTGRTCLAIVDKIKTTKPGRTTMAVVQKVDSASGELGQVFIDLQFKGQIVLRDANTASPEAKSSCE
jgi:peptidoglycan hydrolase-like protein with peptidoglycan-binding domain